jgi:hypothetical protein
VDSPAIRQHVPVINLQENRKIAGVLDLEPELLVPRDKEGLLP